MKPTQIDKRSNKFMAETQNKSFKASPDVQAMLAELVTSLGRSQTRIIEDAIREYHRAHREYKPAPDAHLDYAGE